MFNWTIVYTQLPRLLLQSVLTIALSRLIPPYQFGIFATSVAILAVIEVLREFGLQQTTLAHGKMSDLQVSSLFWFRFVLSIFWTFILFLVWILLNLVNISNDISMVLLFLLPLVGINSALNFTSSILMQNNKYKLLILSDFSGIICGALASLILIYTSHLQYALLGGLLTTSITTTLIRWIGLRFKLFFRVDIQFIKSLIQTNKMSGPLSLINFASKNIDTLCLSIVSTPVSLGHYNRAFQLIEVPLQQLVSATNDQVLKNSSRNLDQPKIFYLFTQSVKILIPIIFSLMFLIFHAETIIPYLLGEIWNASIPLIQILAIGAIFQILGLFGHWIYCARGIDREYFIYTRRIQLLKIALILIGASQGPVGAAIGYSVGHLVTYLVLTFGLGNRISNSASQMIKVQSGILILSAFSVSVGTFVIWPTSFATILTMIISFSLSAILFFILGILTLMTYRSNWIFFSQKNFAIFSKDSVNS